MATKFYLLNESATYTPTAWRGGWDADGSVTKACSPYKLGTGGATASQSESVSTNPFKVGVLRLVSARLAPQTISGTINMVVALNESDGLADFYTRLHAYVVNTSTNAVLGTLLNQYEESSGGGGVEWTTTAVGTALLAAQSLSGVTVPSDGTDYRLVVELGYRSENSSATARTGSVNYGARIGGRSFPDLVVSGPDDPLSHRAGYVEFSGTVSLFTAAPAHASAETALDLTGLLPYTNTFTADSGGHTYSQWFKYTGPADQAVLLFFAFGDLTTYRPTSTVYEDGSAIISGQNKALQIPIVEGSEYLIEVAPNAGDPSPATLSVNVQGQPVDDSSPGDELLLVPDDAMGVCVILATDTDDHVVGALPFPPGEAGDILPPSGVQVVENKLDGTVEVRDIANALLATLSIDVSARPGLIRANPTLGKVYALNYATSVLSTIGPSGAISATHTIGDTHIRAIAVSNDGATLYYATEDDNTLIKRWNLVGNSALSDLSAGSGGSNAIIDLFVLANDTVLAEENHATGPLVMHYSAAGATLHTFDHTGESEGDPPRLARGTNDSITEFWLWTHSPDEVGISRFRKIQISDGSTLKDIAAVEFDHGEYSPDETATPIARIGVSPSCPFYLWEGSLASHSPSPSPSAEGPDDEDGTIGPLVWVEWPRRIPAVEAS